MTLADDLLPVVRAGRAIAGGYGFRVHTVERITRHKNGTVRGVVDEDVVPIVEDNNQPPRVRWLKDEEIAVGSLAHGTVEIGAMTPNAALDAWLQGEGLQKGDERLIRITGPSCPKGDYFAITSVSAERPLRRMIQCKPVEQGSP